MDFKLFSEFKPSGDQPRAIKELLLGLKSDLKQQTLLGVTGSGKTFTIANVIEKINKPTLIIAHNKTLAAQLAQEYKDFFPENAVHYFVSYYDYYQPEAYMPTTDTYIEKEAQINEEIDRLRHLATESLLTRKDVIIVASVSCIYGLGSPVEYEKVNFKVEKGSSILRADFLRRLIDIHYKRTNSDLKPGEFRAVGNIIEIMPASLRVIYRIEIDSGVIKEIYEVNAITRNIEKEREALFIFPAKHFVTDKEKINGIVKNIKEELNERLKEMKKQGKILEPERLKRRTMHDLAFIKEMGYCNGIENYSRHFSERSPGNAPDTLLSYFPKDNNGKPDFLTIIDESHVTVSQIGGMFAGDKSRKETLIEHGFRLPSAKDNRPLNFKEFQERINQTIYTSATPGKFEMEKSEKVVEQIIRPTGLIDPEVLVRPVLGKGNYKGQVNDFINEAEKAIKKGGRVIVTTLTKKMAEDLSDFLKERKIKAKYIHSDIKTIERIEILTEFRRGVFDCIVGVNLLREGLDLPEVTFIGIFDADREGFLRSETSLIQIIGRAARNTEGRVILYADKITGSMERALSETNRRRGIQIKHNQKHNITPKTIYKKINDITESINKIHKKAAKALLEIDINSSGVELKKLIKQKEKQMKEVVKNIDFETAAILRDEILEIKKIVDKKTRKPKL